MRLQVEIFFIVCMAFFIGLYVHAIVFKPAEGPTRKEAILGLATVAVVSISLFLHLYVLLPENVDSLSELLVASGMFIIVNNVFREIKRNGPKRLERFRGKRPR
jgi:hypothetical protein